MASRVPIKAPPQQELRDLYFNHSWTYKTIGEKFGVSAATVCKWFKNYKIDPNRKYAIIEIGGEPHKRCMGSSHGEGGELIPLRNFHKHTNKKYGVHGRCIACETGNQSLPFEKYKPWVESIYKRLGFSETIRRLEINEKTLTNWLGLGKEISPKRIRRSNAIKIATLMLDLRRTGEVRHRKSIRRGAKLRGEQERSVTSQRDLYKRHGDNHTEQKRQSRAKKNFNRTDKFANKRVA